MIKLIFALIFPILALALDPSHLYKTYELRESDFKKAVESLRQSMQSSGLSVDKVLTVSDAIRARSGADFGEYTIIFGCNSPKLQNIPTKAPALLNVVPCSVAIYRINSNVIKVSILNHSPILDAYKSSLTPEEVKEINLTFKKLESAILKLSTKSKPLFRQRIAFKESIVQEFELKGLDYDSAKTLLKSSLDGVNMNVLDILEPAKGVSVFLACNLSYGEEILKKMPEFGTFAPCRVYLISSEKGLKVGFLNIPALVKLFSKYLSQKEREIFEKAYKDMLQAYKDTSGQ
ncbi:MAG: DUF302 domain-containing protein [Aquificaceae bacterium]|nr:DUF302 domain-containing protein [Aquificaceae bacterium]